MKSVLSILFFLLLTNCSPSIDNNSKEFNNMLMKFNTSIPSDTHLYFLLPSFSCQGCTQQSFEKMAKYIIENDKPYITIIFQKSFVGMNVLRNIPVFLFDANNLLESLPFDVANLTIVKTKDNRILGIAYINPENIDQLINIELFNSIRINKPK